MGMKEVSAAARESVEVVHGITSGWVDTFHRSDIDADRVAQERGVDSFVDSGFQCIW